MTERASVGGVAHHQNGAVGGWATAPERRRDLCAYVPTRPDDPEPAYAVADAFEPPHPLAVPEHLCDRLLAAAEAAQPGMRTSGEYHRLKLDPDDEADIVARFREVNDIWWRLDLEGVTLHAKRYRPGD